MGNGVAAHSSSSGIVFESWDVFNFLSGFAVGSGEIDTLQRKTLKLFSTMAKKEKNIVITVAKLFSSQASWHIVQANGTLFSSTQECQLLSAV